MNRPAPSLFAPGPLALSGLIVLAALSRLLPHPPNFSPVEAIALFGGAYFASRQWALVVPLLAMLLIVQLVWALMTASHAETAAGDPARLTSVNELGRVLFTDYMFAFEATSILILVAMVGAVVLARREGPQE